MQTVVPHGIALYVVVCRAIPRYTILWHTMTYHNTAATYDDMRQYSTTYIDTQWYTMVSLGIPCYIIIW